MSEPRGDLLALIPHRPPILCVDRILEADQEHATTERLATVDGGAPDEEVWEGEIIEGVTQTAAVLLNTIARRTGLQLLKGMLVGIRRFEIRRLPRLNEHLRFRVDLVKRINPLSLVLGEVTSGNELIARGELKFFVESGQ